MNIYEYLPDNSFSSKTHAGDYLKEAKELCYNLRDPLQAVLRNLIISFRYVISQDTKDAVQFSH